MKSVVLLLDDPSVAEQYIDAQKTYSVQTRHWIELHEDKDDPSLAYL